MRATFKERALSFFIDMIIISLIVSLICSNLPNNTIKLEESMLSLTEQFTNSEITPDTYIEEYTNLIYDYQNKTVIYTFVNIASIIAYFVMFQYTNNGQTIGKKILKIKVVDQNTKKAPNILKGLLRSLFILNIISGILGLILIYTTSKNIYLLVYGLLSNIESLFIFISAIMIASQKYSRGLHDIMTNTIVIKERS